MGKRVSPWCYTKDVKKLTTWGGLFIGILQTTIHPQPIHIVPRNKAVVENLVGSAICSAI